MPKCKDCEFFEDQNTHDDDRGYCRGHFASVQKVSAAMDTEQCPIKKFALKK